MTTITPIDDLETIERGDFITPINQKTKSLFKVVDKNHTPDGKVRLVLANALTINPKTSTIIPQHHRHWYPQRIATYARVDPSQFPDWVVNKRQTQTNGRFNQIGWQYDWSLFDQNTHVIEPKLRSPFNYETYVVDPIKDSIDKIEKSIANKMEHLDGTVIRSIIQDNWFTSQVISLKSLRSSLDTSQLRLLLLKKQSDKNCPSK
jgi:hypothetical protein